jgi:hypothetical protein
MQMSQQLEISVKQTQIAVKAAIDGDLTARIPIAGKSGEIEGALQGRQLDARYDGRTRQAREGGGLPKCRRAPKKFRRAT